ncbi:hypothetical protein ASE86_05150 [Sphingomonas sp. Leaf33]|uniref:hypothetical protein n=1 Tax=Sphingomonas sp. Leaf33 TaxID=1736215 RepID=UPI000700FF6E|nr:hypothetical protein [Sphingomonas sp. Leaf33]KQN25603.1 hypothetical protein ASE86_05150 [Sphingomonas sp. Leaf33]
MADRDPALNLGQFTERAEAFLGDGFHESVEEVLDDALRLLEKRREAFNAMVRAKIAEADADPRPSVPIDDAFRWLDERKARRRA